MMWKFIITVIIFSASVKGFVAQEVGDVVAGATESSNFTNKWQADIDGSRKENGNSSVANAAVFKIKTTTRPTVVNVSQDMLATTTTSTTNINKIELITDAPMSNTSTIMTTTAHPDSSTEVGPFTFNATTTSTTTQSPISSTSSLPSTSDVTLTSDPYCNPSLCELYNGTHTQVLPHVACHNTGHFATRCGSQPHLLHMSERRRNLILALHNLARSRIASGQVAGYKPASHMPQIKWDTELEHLATMHVQRCSFSHDLCRNTPRFPYSGQNIGYYWIRREIKSHSRRMKNFIVNWFKEHLDADQSFIDAYHLHPEGKKIGHFTQMVADRVHRVGCAAIRYREPDQPMDTKFLMTCNYDYTNIYTEPIYQSGPPASKCTYNISDKYPALCDWKEANYEYEIEENDEEDAENATFNDIRN
ncbi:tabinhibitin 2 [Musca domestica]|uniref:Venom allergen-1 n=1 Tax=Musca domestica TaxID=7370 RepID=A0A1I8MEW3_MUSDO|nr:tabinhibitin 2 [Musca domestica]